MTDKGNGFRHSLFECMKGENMPERRSPLTGAPLPRGKPFEPGSEAQSAGRKGGKASGEKRRAMRTLREELEFLLAEEKTDKSGKKMTVQAGITSALVKSALEGNTRAYELIRDTLGQKPIEKVDINTPDPDIMAEIRRRMERDAP